MILREITKNDEIGILKLYKEYKKYGKDHADIFEGIRDLEKLDTLKFNEWLNVIENNKYENKIPTNYSPQTTFIAIVDNEIVGSINIRWKLVPTLKTYGGNIGYSIRPTKRKKGYGKEMLKLLLNDIVKDKMDKVLITCRDTNIASKKVIESNNGVFENAIYNKKDGYTYLRYWIYLQ